MSKQQKQQDETIPAQGDVISNYAIDMDNIPDLSIAPKGRYRVQVKSASYFQKEKSIAGQYITDTMLNIQCSLIADLSGEFESDCSDQPYKPVSLFVGIPIAELPTIQRSERKEVLNRTFTAFGIPVPTQINDQTPLSLIGAYAIGLVTHYVKDGITYPNLRLELPSN